ncbi:hypothetical protein M9Y10_010071 [Tritrichomonas musculus]|uniref:DUF3447 domain-containing protein n=1 Tax=Tritrichomonas musculus TaxID=1915356 RepID=A0ABR2IS31_9EUKA
MEIKRHLDKKKAIYEQFLIFIESSDNEKEEYYNLINIIQLDNMYENRQEFKHLLCVISQITENYCRKPDFLAKVTKFLLEMGEAITRTFKNTEIFKIFQNSPRILLFLVKNKIISINKSVINLIFKKDPNQFINYSHFLYNEIQFSIEPEKREKIEKELLNINPEIFNDFDKNCQLGENESRICSMIRDDSVEEFVAYVNQTNLPILTAEINHSIFETNTFLLENMNSSLIEYAAFFGAFQIFQYLRLSGCEMRKKIWLYVIHGKNAELIHLLEEHHIRPKGNNYFECFMEAIKCHHNDIANYIKNSYIDYDVSRNKNFLDLVYRTHNYEFLSFDIKYKYCIYFACQYDYIELIKLSFENGKKNMYKEIVYFKCFQTMF